MPIVNLLAPGTGAANSADVVLLDGTAATLSLIGNHPVVIQAKTSTGGYASMGGIAPTEPVQQVLGPVTFRVVRGAVPESNSVDMEKA